jgi:RimJ/RimL family protein N-acetyltransferase
MMSIKLRKIKKSDLPLFLKWWRDPDLIALTSGNFDEHDEKLPGYFFNMLESKIDHHYIIQYEEKAIGHIALMHKNSDTFEITIVIGEKEYWNRGIGTKTIKKALLLGFGKFGYSKSYLEVRPENIRAIKAYESCGFVKKGLKNYPKNRYQPVTLKMVLNKISPK